MPNPNPPPSRTLSEYESKHRIAAVGVPIAQERIVSSGDDAAQAASEIGFPVVAKLCGSGIAHKTERNLVRLGIDDPNSVRRVANELLACARPEDGKVDILVAAMVSGQRELIAGCVQDPTFGPCVMLGIGGVLAEVVSDVVFRLVPLTPADADEMIDDLQHQKWLAPFRGEPAVDRPALAEVLCGLSRLVESDSEILSVDLNPLIISNGKPIAVDALVEVRTA